MPLSKYYGGHGASVMRDMKSRYGEEKGESVFYATENKRKKKKSKKKKGNPHNSQGNRTGGMSVGMKRY